MSDRLPSSTSLRGALVRVSAPFAVLCVFWLSLPANGRAAQPSLKVSYPAATVAGRTMTVTAIIKRAPRGKVTARLERRVGKKWTAAGNVAVSAARTLSLKFTPPASLSSVTLRVVILRGRRVLVTSAAKTLELGQAPRPGGAGDTGQGLVLPAPTGTMPPGPSPGPSTPTQPPASDSRPVAVPAATAVTEAPAPGAAGELHLRGTSNLVSGDYLAVGVGPATPDGFLGQVKSVRAAGGETIVTTEPAALTDVIPEGAIDATMTDTTPSTDEALDARGTSRRAGGSASCEASGAFGVNPHFSLSKSINFRARWSLLRGVESASLTGSVTATASATPTVAVSAHCQLSRTVASFKGAPITFQVGPVPVVLTPNAKIELNAHADADAALSAGLSMTATATAGIGYERSGGVSPIHSFTPSITHTGPTITGAGSASASLTPTIDVLVYGVAGPQIAFKMGLELTGDIYANPWWTLTAPVDLTAQLVVPALKLSTDKLHVYKKTYTLAKATGPYDTQPFIGSVTLRAPGADGNDSPDVSVAVAGSGLGTAPSPTPAPAGGDDFADDALWFGDDESNWQFGKLVDGSGNPNSYGLSIDSYSDSSVTFRLSTTSAYPPPMNGEHFRIAVNGIVCTGIVDYGHAVVPTACDTAN